MGRLDEKKNYKSKVEALAERTIAECRQQGFTVSEMQTFLTLIQIEVMRREEGLKDESF